MHIKPSLFIVLVSISIVSCSDNTLNSDAEPVPEPIIVGQANQDIVDLYQPENMDVGFSVASENSDFTQHRAYIDLTGNGNENLVLDVFAIKDNLWREIIIISVDNTYLPIRLDVDPETDRMNLIDEEASFPIVRALKKGIELNIDELAWRTNRNLFALSQVKGTSYTPSGFRVFGGSTFLPIIIDERLGWVEIEIIFEPAVDIPDLSLKRVALKK